MPLGIPVFSEFAHRPGVIIAPGKHGGHNGASHLLDIHPWLDRKEADVQNAGHFLQGTRLLQDFGKAAVRVAGVGGRDQCGDFHQAADLRAPVEQKPRGPSSGFHKIRVRHGAVGGQGIGMGKHPAGNVGVQIERDDKIPGEAKLGAHHLNESPLHIILAGR